MIVIIIDNQTTLVVNRQGKKTETHKKPGKYVYFDPLGGKILTGYQHIQ